MSTRSRNTPRVAAGIVALVACGYAAAGGMAVYEVGSADVGLASAGYGARAQDAATVLTNPAGMARLPGTQIVAGGQLLWGNTKFSIGEGTSPQLGRNDGGYALGDGGWLLGGGGFVSYTVSPTIKLGFAAANTVGGVLNYDNDWVGRYYVQQTWLVGMSFLPSIAWKATDKLSLGASVNAMYGIYKNNVAVNNLNPLYGDGQLKLKDERWGWGANLGLLYEFTPQTRVGLTWGSQVDLDFNAPVEAINLDPLVRAKLDAAGLLGGSLKVGIKFPQQAMLSAFSQVNDRWALLGSVGWQQWSKFGQVQLGIDDSANPTSITTSIPFKDTWHVAAGAQYRMSEPWLLNFGIAYDSGFQQNSSQISPLLPTNSQWRFGAGAQKDLGHGQSMGFTAEYLYGGTLDTDMRAKPVALGGRGDLVGSYNSTGVIFFGAYYSKAF